MPDASPTDLRAAFDAWKAQNGVVADVKAEFDAATKRKDEAFKEVRKRRYQLEQALKATGLAQVVIDVSLITLRDRGGIDISDIEVVP